VSPNKYRCDLVRFVVFFFFSIFLKLVLNLIVKCQCTDLNCKTRKVGPRRRTDTVIKISYLVELQ
jgi:hypothetical protein